MFFHRHATRQRLTDSQFRQCELVVAGEQGPSGCRLAARIAGGDEDSCGIQRKNGAVLGYGKHTHDADRAGANRTDHGCAPLRRSRKAGRTLQPRLQFRIVFRQSGTQAASPDHDSVLFRKHAVGDGVCVEHPLVRSEHNGAGGKRVEGIGSKAASSSLSTSPTPL